MSVDRLISETGLACKDCTSGSARVCKTTQPIAAGHCAETLDASAILDSIEGVSESAAAPEPRGMSKHVAVLMGGWSAEREVSLRSGKACAEALEKIGGYRVTRIDVGRDIATVLGAVKPDAALNVLHGRPGEDGTLQGLLETIAIPYTHSGVLASALAMQKDVAKVIFRAAHIPVPDGVVLSRFEAAKAHALPRPYVIKPVAEGSSVGVFIVTDEHEHPPQELYRDDWPFGEWVLCERYIPGRELTCAVMGDKALDVIEILPTVRFYDYEAKYVAGG